MQHVFESMSSQKIAGCVRSARERIVLVVPSLHPTVAEAMVSSKVSSESISVVLDCSEKVFRLGYGTLEAVKALGGAGIIVRQSPGLRIGVLICDGLAWVFAPTALFVEDEIHSDETPNAVRVGTEEAHRIAVAVLGFDAFSPPSKQDALSAATPSAKEPEIGTFFLASTEIQKVDEALAVAPPLPFDIARQVHVFQPYIQYVEVNLLGCAIQRRKIDIPKSVLRLGGDGEIEQRLQTTFKLIEKNSAVSSRVLDDELRKVLDTFTRSLGKPWGRVLLRSKRGDFDSKIASIRAKLEDHKIKVMKSLQEHLDRSLGSLMAYYFPIVMENPPEELTAQISGNKPTDKQACSWLDEELQKVIPKPNELLTEMRLNVQYRDVTYETLTEKGFDLALKREFHLMDWEKPFKEFKAAKAQEPGKSVP